jgi:sugar phosphate isomerase/epimerase
MKISRLALLCGVAVCGGLGRAAEANPFFAMNTIARGPPEVVVPLLQELGYAGLGGAAGDRAMAGALQQAGLRFFNGYLSVPLQADATGLPGRTVAAPIDAMRGLDTALWLTVSKLQRDVPAGISAFPLDDDAVAARLREIANYAAKRGVKVALYPHTGHFSSFG